MNIEQQRRKWGVPIPVELNRLWGQTLDDLHEMDKKCGVNAGANDDIRGLYWLGNYLVELAHDRGISKDDVHKWATELADNIANKSVDQHLNNV